MCKHSGFGASVLLLTALWGCSVDQKTEELARQPSPNQELVAVMMETLTGGAAGSVYEDIYINDKGLPLNLKDPVLGAVGCDHLRIGWANDYTLEIRYESTCTIRHFTNRWSRPSDVAAGRPNPIEIILIRN